MNHSNNVIFNFFIMQIMGDKNLEDGDIEPAPKLIQVVFQNCRGQVDLWVEPYIRITVERLRRAEKPYLKCLLIEVVGIYYFWKFQLIEVPLDACFFVIYIGWFGKTLL